MITSIQSTDLQLKILAFGITKDIVGGSSFEVTLAEGSTVSDLKNYLKEQFPAMGDLAALLIAVNSEYGEETQVLKKGDDIALIPPVSGG